MHYVERIKFCQFGMFRSSAHQTRYRIMEKASEKNEECGKKRRSRSGRGGEESDGGQCPPALAVYIISKLVLCFKILRYFEIRYKLHGVTGIGA